MGSLLSPVAANLYMEHFEEVALQTAPLPPKLWTRYVDDTFVVWPHGQTELERFHGHLNAQHQNINFTVEHERDKQLAFQMLKSPELIRNAKLVFTAKPPTQNITFCFTPTTIRGPSQEF